jgi:hypothetical protein
MIIQQHKPLELSVRRHHLLRRYSSLATLVALSLLITACSSNGWDFFAKAKSELMGSPVVDANLAASCAAAVQVSSGQAQKAALASPVGIGEPGPISVPDASGVSPSTPPTRASPQNSLDSLPSEVQESFSVSHQDYLFPPTVKMPDFSRIALRWLGNGYTRVEGAAGAIPGEFPVLVTSPNTASTAVTRSASNGCFSVEIAAPPGSWVIVKYDPTHASNLIHDTSLEPEPGNQKIRITSVQHAAGGWAMVPFSSPSAPGVPFVVSSTTNVGDYLGFTLCGSMTGDWRQGGTQPSLVSPRSILRID